MFQSTPGVLINIVLLTLIISTINWAVLSNSITLKRIGIKTLFIGFMFTVFRLFLPFNIPFPIVLTVPYPFLVQSLSNLFNIEIFGQNLLSILLIVWISVSCTLLIRFFYKYIRFKKLLESFSSHNKSDSLSIKIMNSIITQNHLKKTFKLIKSDSVQQPFIFGVLNPTIALPNRYYSECDLKFILTHEIQHYINRDTLWKFCFNILKSLYWWLPTIYIIDRQLAVFLEINCDNNCLKDLTYFSKIDYLECLLAEARHISKTLNKNIVSSVITDDSILRKRFDIILLDTQMSKKNRGIVKLIFYFIFLLSLAIMFFPAVH
ncbi:MAG: M56 family metallopeptidase [Oscillospiraceae bacterium]